MYEFLLSTSNSNRNSYFIVGATDGEPEEKSGGRGAAGNLDVPSPESETGAGGRWSEVNLSAMCPDGGPPSRPRAPRRPRDEPPRVISAKKLIFSVSVENKYDQRYYK